MPLEKKKLQNELADPTVRQGLSDFGSALNQAQMLRLGARWGVRQASPQTILGVALK